jgi:hypothetical protein
MRLGMVRAVVQEKKLEAKVTYEAKMTKNPKNPKDPSLREFKIDLIPGAAPVHQDMHRFTAEEIQSISHSYGRASLDQLRLELSE